jgi:gliding motility-associated-like protein
MFVVPMSLYNYCLHIALLLGLLPVAFCSRGQCFPESGPPPSNVEFNTGSNGRGGTLPPGTDDPRWIVAADSINGVYAPVVVMDSLPPDYYKSPWRDCRWISLSRTGNHSSNHHFFFKKEFTLPCNNPCGKSYNSENTFCLSLDVLADNSVYEIYVNGVRQSGHLGNVIPVKPDPLHAVGMGEAGMISFSLCNNWKAGANSLVLEVASSAPVTGILVQASTVFRESLSNFVQASICQGSSYVFGSQTLTRPGVAYENYVTAGGCDSSVALALHVNPTSRSTIEHTICKGESFLGYAATGTYLDTFRAVNGCDSLRILRLSVQETPPPDLPAKVLLCKGDSLLLTPGKYLTYLWQDFSTQNQLRVRTPGVYRVRVGDKCGEAEGSVTVTESTCGVYFPSAITPNGDGLNDAFKVLTNDHLEEYQLTVCNRWGQVVFNSHVQSAGWNGTFQGNPQATGVFAWTCRFKRRGVITQMKGTIMLIR